jgi:antitoxin component HigA of HigAB toxin-antitoxin module
MWLMKNKPVWSPDEAAAPAPAADAAPADASTTLYPDDAAPAADTPSAEGDTPAPDAAAAAEWSEYVNDDTKTPEENAAAKAENDAKNPLNQVPEDGKYNLKMPEGIELDTALLDGIAPTLKDLNLSHTQAQALVDKFIDTQKSKAEAATAKWGETVAGWQEQAKKDPEIGGAKWADTERDAVSAVRRFGTPALTEYLEASGAGNHPEIIRLMAKVGSMIAEDNPAISENPGGKGGKDASARLYPDDTPKGK